MQSTAYELKYCERCGSLGVRRTNSAKTYCEPCGQSLSNFLLIRRQPRGNWLPGKRAAKAETVLQPGTAAAGVGGGRVQ
jgi:ribosomal protein L37AE/L43A